MHIHPHPHIYTPTHPPTNTPTQVRALARKVGADDSQSIINSANYFIVLSFPHEWDAQQGFDMLHNKRRSLFQDAQVCACVLQCVCGNV